MRCAAKRASFDAHVHLGVAFHGAFDPLVGLFLGLFHQFARKKKPEEHSDDRHHQRPARMLQGFGLGFLIVPITQVAYSYLPLEKNNRASSLTNLFRNEGGSFGTTFANTVLAQRGQFHQSILAQHLTPDSSIYRDWVQQFTSAFIHAGYSAIEAANRAEGQLYSILTQQASLPGKPANAH